MPDRVRCPKCRGEVGIPDEATGKILCPKCKEFVFSVDPETHVKWRPEEPRPAWMKPWGYVLTLLGGLAFAASTFVNWPKSSYPDGNEYVVAMFAGVTNPLCFIGLPLGLYWLSRTGALLKIFSALRKF